MAYFLINISSLPCYSSMKQLMAVFSPVFACLTAIQCPFLANNCYHKSIWDLRNAWFLYVLGDTAMALSICICLAIMDTSLIVHYWIIWRVSGLRMGLASQEESNDSLPASAFCAIC